MSEENQAQFDPKPDDSIATASASAAAAAAAAASSAAIDDLDMEMMIDMELDMDMEASADDDDAAMPGIVSLDDNVASISGSSGGVRRPLGSGNSTDTSLCNVRRLKHELDEIRAHPPPYCCVAIKAEDLYHWVAIVNGPAGSVYEGGHFRLDVRFPASYPFKPPQIRFVTRIYHCNVDRCGAICLDILGERWSPIITVSKVLLSIYLLMSECNPDDPLDGYIADMYKNNRVEHDRIARYWTKRFAKPEGE